MPCCCLENNNRQQIMRVRAVVLAPLKLLSGSTRPFGGGYRGIGGGGGSNGATACTYILVESDGGRGVLEKNVGHSDLELPELGHLSNDLAGDEVAPSRGSGHGDRPLSPGGLPGHDLPQNDQLGRHAIGLLVTVTATCRYKFSRDIMRGQV